MFSSPVITTVRFCHAAFYGNRDSYRYSSLRSVSAITDESTGSTLEGFLFLGLDTIVEYEDPEPNVNLSRIPVRPRRQVAAGV